MTKVSIYNKRKTDLIPRRRYTHFAISGKLRAGAVTLEFLTSY